MVVAVLSSALIRSYYHLLSDNYRKTIQLLPEMKSYSLLRFFWTSVSTNRYIVIISAVA